MILISQSQPIFLSLSWPFCIVFSTSLSVSYFCLSLSLQWVSVFLILLPACVSMRLSLYQPLCMCLSHSMWSFLLLCVCCWQWNFEDISTGNKFLNLIENSFFLQTTTTKAVTEHNAINDDCKFIFDLQIKFIKLGSAVDFVNMSVP